GVSGLSGAPSLSGVSGLTSSFSFAATLILLAINFSSRPPLALGARHRIRAPLPYGDSPRIHRTDTRHPPRPPPTGPPITQKGSAYPGTARIARPVSWSRPKLRLTLFVQRQQGVIPVPPSSVVPVPARKGSKTLRRPAR